VLEPRPATAPAIEISYPLPVSQSQSQPRISLPGSGVRAPSRSRRILRIVRSIERNGPGLGPVLLILLAVVLAGTAVLLRMRRHARVAQSAEAIHDAAATSMTREPGGATPDAQEVTLPGDAALAGATAMEPALLDASAPAPDAGPQGSDARPRGPEPGPRTREPAAAVRTSSLADKIAEAKVLYDKAHDALEEGDFTRALELADASLKQRRTARTYLLRAQAQQRLDRIEDSLASVDAATLLAPGYASVWELRGRILWAARRHDEARAAFDKFLELDPDNPKAASVRRLMNEPR
jgi:tetratricopeptide (TPR) repeat protein